MAEIMVDQQRKKTYLMKTMYIEVVVIILLRTQTMQKLLAKLNLLIRLMISLD